MSNTTAIETSKRGGDAQQQLTALRKANFNWTLHLQSIWQDQPHHVDGLHPQLSKEFSEKLTELKSRSSSSSPLGWAMVGAGGAGKTHLLGRMRAEAIRQKCAFILVDMTDVRDFWETVGLGYTSSLQEEYAAGCTQIEFIVRELIAGMSRRGKTDDNLRAIVNADSALLKRYNQEILNALAKRHRGSRHLVARFQDTIRALVATNSENFEISNLGQMFLQGLELDEQDARQIGLNTTQQISARTVEALSWTISLSMPTVLAFDQLDPIVRQLDYEAEMGETADNAQQQAVANSIISGIGDGLRSLYDVTYRTLTLLSCLESSWEILQHRALQTSSDRFEDPRVLRQLNSADQSQALVSARMKLATDATSFKPPYASWPFRPEAFTGLSNVTPRELLKLCQKHRKRCLDAERVTEVVSFVDKAPSSKLDSAAGEDGLDELDRRFAELRDQVEVDALLAEESEDQRLAALLVATCHTVLHEISLPDDVHAVIDTQFTGAKSTKPLHARIRLVLHAEQEREEHYSIRALQRKHATAFQNRLKLALTQAGIDQALSFRHLTLLRCRDFPGGSVTSKMISTYRAAGGRFCWPEVEELKTLDALRQLANAQDPNWSDWLASRRPASQTEFCRVAFSELLHRFSQPPDSDPEVVPVGHEVSPSTAEEPQPRAGSGEASSTALGGSEIQVEVPGRDGDYDLACRGSDGLLPLGRKLIAGHPGDAVSIPIGLLNKHAVVLAGAGSGKTVLLKRLVEEAAVRRIPSIILDGANDMSALGDRWPSRPEAWSEEDVELADRYHAGVEPMIWTPGRRGGNPLCLEMLPDLSATAGDPDDFDAAVSMVSGGLADLLNLGKSKGDENRKGILSKSLRFYIQQECWGLSGFIELLEDLPEDARLGIRKELAMAKDLADRLRVVEETDPLIGAGGEPLDPAVLFGDDKPRDRTRVSIVNLNFLATDEKQQRFVNQLATTLFAWIKQNPSVSGRPLRGLLVIDEAKDLVPSRRSTACKDSLMRLTAQARKYQLGLVYATQNPREIDNAIIGNCSTQYYGRANAPAAIETIRQQMAMRRGDANDIGHLKRGSFYVFNADAEMKCPVKVQIPLCLSHHQTLNSDQVLERAAESPS